MLLKTGEEMNDPCYKVAKNLAELYSSVSWTAEFVVMNLVI